MPNKRVRHSQVALFVGFGGLLALMAMGGFGAVRFLRQIQENNNEIRRDFLRRLLQALRELERNGDGDLSEGSLTRLLQSEIGIDAELRAQAVAKRRMNLLLKVVEHGNLEYSDGAGTSAAVSGSNHSEAPLSSVFDPGTPAGSRQESS